MNTKKLTVKDWLQVFNGDIDVYDNYTGELCIAYVGGDGYPLTPEGEEYFKDVLGYTLDIDGDECVIVIVDDDLVDEGPETRLERAIEFFHSAAGDCSESKYKLYFKE